MHTETSAEQRFGAQVREAREGRGWSQEALARNLRDTTGIDLHQTAIARLERGERAIRFNEVAAMANLLGLDLTPYSSTAPPLTPEEYENAVRSLEKVREMEQDLGRREAALDGELDDLRQERGRLANMRQTLAEMTRAYEERQRG